MIENTIEILGKNYQIKCEENELPALQKAADYLNSILKTMPQSGRLLAPDKLGMMAALNLASQFLELEEQVNEQKQFLDLHLQHLLDKLENALLPSADETASFHLEVESAEA